MLPVALEPAAKKNSAPLQSRSRGNSLRGRTLLRLADLSADELEGIVQLAISLKAQPPEAQFPILAGKTLAMLFEQPSLRTRVSFQVAMQQLGGDVLFAQGAEFMLGSRESPEDAARVLSRFVDALVVRTHGHELLERFAAASTVPVINGLSSAAHPCQAIADILTLHERFGSIRNLRVAYVGDGRNNVAISLAEAVVLCGGRMHFGTPPTHRPSEAFLNHLRRLGKPRGGSARAFSSAVRAIRGVDAVYTDIWTSMGEEALKERNEAQLRLYSVTEELLTFASAHAIFLHCLPAHRGEEVASAVIDGPRSLVFDQAENRMHAQKALLVTLLSDLKGAAL